MTMRNWWTDSHLHWIFAYSHKYQARVATTVYRLVVLVLLTVIAVRIK